MSVRWFVGTFGPELSFSAVTWQEPNGHITRVGYTAREGEISRTDRCDVIEYNEPDGFTHRGGWLTVGEGDEEIIVDAELVDGAVMGQRAWKELNTVCRTREAGGLRGMADLHCINNALGGTAPFPGAVSALMGNGSGKREPLSAPRTFDEAVARRAAKRS